MTFGGVQHGPGPAPWAEAVAATLAALVPAQAQPQKNADKGEDMTRIE
jgi:hypothetical protein